MFKPIISCEAFTECENYEVAKNPKVNCGHITIIKDKLYCKRSHVGSLKLPREKAEVRREEGQIMVKMLGRYVKNPKVKELLKTTLMKKDLLEGLYIAPSTIVEEEKGEEVHEQT